ncbi:hypothetical protein CYCD_08330 [Tenuifilaceae bacterium CYCD]|nr:hypothetical protein CYCD_08330 [Tenuifilaceae bacterium CYCD]
MSVIIPTVLAFTASILLHVLPTLSVILWSVITFQTELLDLEESTREFLYGIIAENHNNLNQIMPFNSLYYNNN